MKGRAWWRWRESEAEEEGKGRRGDGLVAEQRKRGARRDVWRKRRGPMARDLQPEEMV